MARVEIPVTTITREGVADASPVTGDSVNNHFMVNDGKTEFEANNPTASAVNVTVNFAKTVDGQTVTPRTYSIASSDKRRIGPWPQPQYGAQLDIDVDGSIELTAYRIG